MNIDKRLEALKQSLSQMRQENEKLDNENMAKLDGYMAEMMQGIARLSHIGATGRSRQAD
jgi:hypothetical protein